MATSIDDNVADGNLSDRNIRLINVDYTRRKTKVYINEKKDKQISL